MKIKICPKCKSSNITLYMGGKFGKYICKDCGYVGPLVIEKVLETKFSKPFRKNKVFSKRNRRKN